MASVERYGLEDTLAGYDLATADKSCMFSLWQGNNLRCSYNGEDSHESKELLTNFLGAIAQNNGNAIYGLRFHNKTDADGEISNKTPYVGSFNFKMTPPPQTSYMLPAMSGQQPQAYSLRQELQDFKQEVLGMLGNAPAPVENTDERLRMVKEIMEIPLVAGLISGISKSIPFFDAEAYRNQQLRGIAGTGIHNNNTDDVDLTTTDMSGIPHEINLSDKDANRLNAALYALLQVDKDFVTVLEKLAKMAKETPDKYRMAKGFL